MKDHVRPGSEKRPADPNSASSHRRRIIKAAAVSPAIFTLHSGAARAALSSYQCIARGASKRPEELHIGRYGKDRWVRAKVTTQNTPQGDVRDIVKVQKLSKDGRPTSVYERLIRYRKSGWLDPRQGRFAEINEEHLRSAGIPRSAYDAGNTIKGRFFEDRRGYWREVVSARARGQTAVYVDNKGRICGTDPSNEGKCVAVTHSCWASFV